MHLIYGLLVNFIIAFALLIFYSQFQKQKFEIFALLLIPAMYSAYRFLTTDIRIIDPVRLLLSPIFFAIAIIFFKKKLSWIFLITSFFVTQALWLLTFTLSAITIATFYLTIQIDEANPFFFVVPWLLIIYSGVFLLIKHQKINLWNYGKLLESPLIRKMIYLIGILIVTLYSFIHLTEYMEIGSDLVASVIIIGLIAIVITTTIFLTIFITKHLKKEQKQHEEDKRQRGLLEKENQRLKEEQSKLQAQLSELDQSYIKLKEGFDNITSTHHQYRYVVPVLMGMQQKLIEEIQYFADYTHEEKMDRIKDFSDQINSLAVGITDDFVEDHIKDKMVSLKIPENYHQLVVLLEKLMQKAHSNEIYLSLYNQGSHWNELDVPDRILIRLLSNLVDNAIKESCKIPVEERGEVQIIFCDDDEYFAFEVRDFASEFDLSILENLGSRKNSTNGTGDGYAEIMEDLETLKASIMLKEWRRNNQCGKSIMITFDGYEMKWIDSHYRQDLLMEKLEGKPLKVMGLYG